MMMMSMSMMMLMMMMKILSSLLYNGRRPYAKKKSQRKRRWKTYGALSLCCSLHAKITLLLLLLPQMCIEERFEFLVMVTIAYFFQLHGLRFVTYIVRRQCSLLLPTSAVTFNPIFFSLVPNFFLLLVAATVNCYRNYIHVYFTVLLAQFLMRKIYLQHGGEMCQSLRELARVSIILTLVGRCVPYLSYYLLQLFSSCKLRKLVSYFKCDTMWYYYRAIFSAECNLFERLFQSRESKQFPRSFHTTRRMPGIGCKGVRSLQCLLFFGQRTQIVHSQWWKTRSILRIDYIQESSFKQCLLAVGGQAGLLGKLFKTLMQRHVSTTQMQMSRHDTPMQNLVP